MGSRQDQREHEQDPHRSAAHPETISQTRRHSGNDPSRSGANQPGGRGIGHKARLPNFSRRQPVRPAKPAAPVAAQGACHYPPRALPIRRSMTNESSAGGAGRRASISTWLTGFLLAACAGSAVTTTTAVTPAGSTTSRPVEEPATEGPRVAPVDPCSFLSLDQVDVALGLLDLPLEERGIFTFSGGESCVWEHDAEDGAVRTLRVEPGSPTTLPMGPGLVVRRGRRLPGLAIWQFGSPPLSSKP